MTGSGGALVSIGLDIGATKVHGVAVDGNGEIVAEHRTATEAGPEGVVRSAAAVVDTLAAALGMTASAAPIGVGVPGLVDPKHGAVKHAVNLGLEGDWFPIGDRLADRLGTSVLVENDVNAATLGAHQLAGVDDVAYVSLGTGLAAGMVLDGHLRRGFHGAAGEIGHLPVDPRGPLCSCGQRGCLELVASGRALAAAWPSSEQPPAQALFAAAADGDPAAIATRDRFTEGVAAAVRLIALSTDPRIVVIGGGVAALGEPLRAAVSEALTRQAVGSAFLASLDLPGRLRIVPPGVPVAALGAATLGRAR